MELQKKSVEERVKDVEKIFNDVADEVKNYTASEEDLLHLLDWQEKFYNYSINNSLLIQMQFRGAEAVGSFSFWNECGYRVNKGEQGIQILVPCKRSDYIIRETSEGEKKIPLSKITQLEKEKIQKGELEVHKGQLYYKIGYVFDISQTNCPVSEIPRLFPNRWIEGEVKDYKVFWIGIEKIAKDMHVDIINPYEELGAAKGISYTGTDTIALNPRNSELQNIKTALHELTHAKLHTLDSKLTRPEKEFQAEITAYVVCKHFGLDTSDYSIKYLHTWTENHPEIWETQQLLMEAAKTAKEFIDTLCTEELLIQKQMDSDMNKFNALAEEISMFYEQVGPFEKSDIESVKNDLGNNAAEGILQDLKTFLDDSTYKTTNDMTAASKLACDIVTFLDFDVDTYTNEQLGISGDEIYDIKNYTMPVAVESTNDYSDINFQPNMFNTSGTGREDYYRIVYINCYGELQPLTEEIFRSEGEARQSLKDSNYLTLKDYDTLVYFAGNKQCLEPIRELRDNRKMEINTYKEVMELMHYNLVSVNGQDTRWVDTEGNELRFERLSAIKEHMQDYYNEKDIKELPAQEAALIYNVVYDKEFSVDESNLREARRYNENGERLWNGKTVEQFTQKDALDFGLSGGDMKDLHAHPFAEVKQVDRMKGEYHIFQHKHSNAVFIGKRNEENVIQVTDSLALADAKDKLKALNANTVLSENMDLSL